MTTILALIGCATGVAAYVQARRNKRDIADNDMRQWSLLVNALDNVNKRVLNGR